MHVAGTVIPLRFDFAAICRMQDEHGINVLDDKTWTPSPKLFAVLIWGGCLHAQPQLKLAEVARSVPLKDILSLHKKCVAVLNEDMPELKKLDEEPAAPV